MAARKKSSKITKAVSRKPTGETANGSAMTSPASNSGKVEQRYRTPRFVTNRVKVPVSRAPLLEDEPEEKVQRCELVDFHTTNSNIIQQLRMVTRYPFIVDEDTRLAAMDAIREAVSEDQAISVRLQGAAALASLLKVNLGVFRQLANDQFQRHLPFDKQASDIDAQKQAALDSMSDEELELLEKMAEKMGGSIELGS